MGITVMRPLYFILKGTLQFSLRLYHKRIKTYNAPKTWRTRTIFISNHPSAFMDPLVISVIQNPVVHFLVRSDVFKSAVKPILWAVHMIPIYRSLDGAGAVKKNDEVFEACAKVLRRKKGLIIFGEGGTLDVFARRAKPLKKGAARIAFGYVEKFGWEDDLKLQAVGLNYSDPSYFRGEVLIANGPTIHLSDYKELHEENPNKAMSQLTRDMQTMMRDQITHLEDAKLSPMHDHITSMTGWGLHKINADGSIPLVERWKASRWLAKEINSQESEHWEGLKNDLASYHRNLNKNGIEEKHLRGAVNGRSPLSDILLTVLRFPTAIIGMVHHFIPWIITKSLVEKMFKRRVFWSGVKMVLGKFIHLLFNLPFIWLFYDFIYPNYWVASIYVILITPILGAMAYVWVRRIKNMGQYAKARKLKGKLSSKRDEMIQEIKEAGLWNDGKTV